MKHPTISQILEGIGWSVLATTLVMLFIVVATAREIDYLGVVFLAIAGAYVIRVTFGIRQNRHTLYGKKDDR